LYQSARTHDLTIQEKKKIVQNYELRVVVNLWRPYDWDMEQIVEDYLHIYVPDGKTPILDVMLPLAKGLGGMVRNGLHVLVHCYGGRNRSGFLNALIYMVLTGKNGEQAIEHIRTCRPHSLVNEHFVSTLMEFKNGISNR
jgi:protein-tyrosine phosphatase